MVAQPNLFIIIKSYLLVRYTCFVFVLWYFENMNNSNKFKPYRHSTNYYREVKRIRAGTQNISLALPKLSSLAKIVTHTASAGISSDDDLNSISHNNYDNPNLSHQVDWENTLPDEDPDDTDDTAEDIEVLTDQISLLEELRLWALSFKIPQNALGALLNLLRNHGKTELPRDSRTLLKTPSTVVIREMGSGKFWYNGIKESLINSLSNIQSPQSVSILFNTDGISPFNSSNYQFWPISFLIHELRDKIPPMVAAIYYGENKPPLKEYLNEFVKELKEMLLHGVIVNNQKVTVRVNCFVCDTPARSFIKGKFIAILKGN